VARKIAFTLEMVFTKMLQAEKEKEEKHC
jgi:hypothetical protein